MLHVLKWWYCWTPPLMHLLSGLRPKTSLQYPPSQPHLLLSPYYNTYIYANSIFGMEELNEMKLIFLIFLFLYLIFKFEVKIILLRENFYFRNKLERFFTLNFIERLFQKK